MLNENMNIRLILISNVSKRRANTNLICQHKRGHVTSYINLFGLVHLDLFKETTLYITFQLAKQNGKLSTWLTHLAFAINLTIEREKKKKKKGGKKNFWFARYESVTNYCIDIHKHIRRMKCIRIETHFFPVLLSRRDEKYYKRCFKIFDRIVDRWKFRYQADIEFRIHFGPSGLEESSYGFQPCCAIDICESGIEGGESEAVIRVEKVKQCF